MNAIGISGGGIAWPHVAGAARDLVSAMVIVSAPPYFLEQARALRRLASDTLLPPGEAARMRQRHVHGEDQIAARFAQARGLADHVDDVSFTPPALARIETETLVVFGDRDPFYPVSLALDLRGAIPRSHLWVIPNGGHAPVFGEHAPAFASTTLAFLKGEWSRADAPAA